MESGTEGENRQDAGVYGADDSWRFARQVLIVVGISAAAAALALILWYAVHVLLMAFGGLLLAILLRGISSRIAARTGLSMQWSFLITLLVLITLSVLATWFLAPRIADQIHKMVDELPTAVKHTQDYLGRFSRLLPPPAGDLTDSEVLRKHLSGILKQATGFFATTIGFVTTSAIILFIGLYLAYDPDLYVRGFLHLVPFGRRQRAREVLDALHHTLSWWLIGRLLDMLIIGVFTWMGLLLLGVPLALILGILAGLLTFIPYIGPLLSFIPAALFALVQGPNQLLYVSLLYLGIQTVESYLITPVVQQATVALPPVVTIVAQIVLGILLGFLGIVFATPLVAASVQAVKMLYIQDILGDDLVKR